MTAAFTGSNPVSPATIKSSDYSEKATPVPIPNTEVKFLSADDTWGATPWESKTLLVFSKIAQLVEQSAVNR